MKFILPKFWNKRWNLTFRSTFQGREYSIWTTNNWKFIRKSGFHLLFLLPKSSFGEHKSFYYPPNESAFGKVRSAFPNIRLGEHKVDARHSAKADIAHRLANRSMCDESPMMRVVIFLAKSDKSRDRASTGDSEQWRIESVDVRWCVFCFFLAMSMRHLKHIAAIIIVWFR